MMDAFKNLHALPGTPQERVWLRDRLETLSVLEGIALSAALQRHSPETAMEAVNSLLSLSDYTVCFPAANHEQLGRLCLRQKSIPETLDPYVNLDGLGRQYEDTHPGQFIGNCYVADPTESPRYYGRDSPLPEDADWSVKLKLASPSCQEGVWVRLPDFAAITADQAAEVLLALDVLRVQSLEDCTLLDARCILPEAGNLMEQYDSITELANDGNDLGIVLDERNQGMPHFMERFTAALEYETCRSLRFAPDISQNLSCYEWISCEGLKDFGVNHLRTCGVAEELIQSGTVDLRQYAEDLLESAGYMLTRDESGYIARNNQEFLYERSAPPNSMDLNIESQI